MTLHTGASNGWRHEIAKLHEYAHAFLAETVHPLFGVTKYAHTGEDQRLNQLFRTAADWFVVALTMKLVPAQQRAEIKEIFLMLAARLRLGGQYSMIYHAAYTAMYKKWVYPECVPIPSIAKLADTFLAVNPDPPTLKNFQQLLDTLCGHFGYHVELEGSAENPMAFWDVSNI